MTDNPIKKSRGIPDATLKRLPHYLRTLRVMLCNGDLKISSSELAAKIGLNASQIRADLSYFVGAGQKGYGYSIKSLYTEISREMGIGRAIKVAVIGKAEVALPLSASNLLGAWGISADAIFSPATIECKAEGLDIPVMSIDDFPDYARHQKPDVVVICSYFPGIDKTVQIAADEGVGGIWNLTSYDLHVPNTVLRNDFPGDGLLMLCREINEKK